MVEYQTVQSEALPLNENVRILEANADGLVAIEKPPGALSHPNKREEIARSVLRANYDYANEYFFWEGEEGRECRAWLINRLDSPTSGVMLLALNEQISGIVKQVFATHKASKFYYAIVRHVPKTNAGTWSDKLRKDAVVGARKIKKLRQVSAKSDFQLITKPTGGFPVAMLKLSPITGRTHQLRVQCKKHGHPIVGDRTYGHFAFNKEVRLETGEKRMMLHSAETVLNYYYKGRVRTFRAKSEIPDAFHRVLQFRPGMKPAKQARSESAESSQVLKGRRFKEA